MLTDPKIINKIISEKQSEYSKAHFVLISEYLHQGQNSVTRDLDCNLILSYLIFKTFESMISKNLNFNYDELLNFNQYETIKLKKSEIAKYLRMPRETVRRKVNKLNNYGLIKINKNEINVKSQSLKDINLKRYEIYLNKCMHVVIKNYENKEYDNKNLKQVKINLKKNFLLVWSYFLEMFVQIATIWRNYFSSLECWYLFGSCSLNQMYNTKYFVDFNLKKIDNTENFFLNITEKRNSRGLNPTTLSDLTGIPRATVMRNLEKLSKQRSIKSNSENLFFIPRNTNQKKSIMKNLEAVHKIVSQLCSKILNLYL